MESSAHMGPHDPVHYKKLEISFKLIFRDGQMFKRILYYPSALI